MEAIFTVLAIHHVCRLPSLGYEQQLNLYQKRKHSCAQLTSPSAVFRESRRLRLTWSSRTRCSKGRSRHYLRPRRRRYERPSPTLSGLVELTRRCCSRARPSFNSTLPSVPRLLAGSEEAYWNIQICSGINIGRHHPRLAEVEEASGL